MKRFLSMILCLSIICSLYVPAYATNTITNEYPTTDSTQLPRGVILEEGEVWEPASTSIMPYSMTIQIPDGYTYIGRIVGTMSYEVTLLDIGATVFSYSIGLAKILPWLGTVLFLWSTGELLYGYSVGSQPLSGPYYKYICAKDDPGIFDYYYYCEYEFYIDAINEAGRHIFETIGRKTTYEWERI